MSFPEFFLVFDDRFLAMHDTLSLDLVDVHPPLSSSGSWPPREQDQRTLTKVQLE